MAVRLRLRTGGGVGRRITACLMSCVTRRRAGPAVLRGLGPTLAAAEARVSVILCKQVSVSFPEAITSVFPQTLVQTCIVHLIRNSLAVVAVDPIGRTLE